MQQKEEKEEEGEKEFKFQERKKSFSKREIINFFPHNSKTKLKKNH